MTELRGNYPDIYAELTRIRRDADDGLTPHLIAASPLLCKVLGNGDPFLATGDLRDRLSTAAARGDRDILAYWYSLMAGGDATARLVEAGNRLSVEYRRARDLSDRGALKLSQIIGSDQDWQVPFMGFGITINGWEATIEGYVMVATDFRNYHHPKFIADEQEITLGHQQIDQGDWERHAYGPLAIPLSGNQCRIQMRRIGTPKIRVKTYVRSNNLDVRVGSSLVLLDYVAEFTVRRGASGIADGPDELHE
ncbi:Uncharacterised protein [Mycobacteroides abscessus subsp. abscessus]|nr:Uncharacterised protein [Mycobacteroides abscessus subsp. abscessus]